MCRFKSDRSAVWALASLFILLWSVSLTRATEAVPGKQSLTNDLLIDAYRLEREGHFDAALATYYDLFQARSATASPDSLNPRNRTRQITAMWRATQLHQRLRQDVEAKRLAEQLLEKKSKSIHPAAIWLTLGELAQRGKDPTVAGHWFEKILANFPQTAHAREAAYWLAVAAADESKWDVARRHASWLEQELLRQNEFGTGDKRQLQLLTHTLHLQTHIAVQNSNWQEVQHLATRLLDGMPEVPTSNVALFWAAESNYRLGREDRAREQFVRLATRVIGSNELWLPMIPLRTAQLAARRQRWTEVLAITERTIREYPGFQLQYEVDYLRGRALAGRGRMSEARRAYQRTIDRCIDLEKEPATVTMAQWMIGETYFHQRHYQNAREAYRKVIEEHHAAAWQARAALQLGKCWELEGEWEKAKTVYTEALERWPEEQDQQELQARLSWSLQHIEVKRR